MRIGGSCSTSRARCRDCDWPAIDLVIECIPEKLPAKQALFAQLVGLRSR